jgi:hypothetical protein
MPLYNENLGWCPYIVRVSSRVVPIVFIILNIEFVFNIVIAVGAWYDCSPVTLRKFAGSG